MPYGIFHDIEEYSVQWLDIGCPTLNLDRKILGQKNGAEDKIIEDKIMKTKPAIAGVAACTVMLALAGCSPDRSGVERPLRWEYKVLEIENAYHRVENEHAMSRDKADREKEKVVKLMPGMFQWDPDKLEALGRDGWELVAVIPQAETVYGGFSGDPERANTRTAAVHLFFKRPAKR